MNKILLFFLTFLTLACNGQDTKQDKFTLTISPIVNQNNQSNQKIIEALVGFLKTKNSSLTENLFWVQSDFQKFIYPYLDIYNIESSRYGSDFFRPTLM